MDYSWPVEADQQDMVGQRGFAQGRLAFRKKGNCSPAIGAPIDRWSNAAAENTSPN
jgi:hypothetical protein